MYNSKRCKINWIYIAAYFIPALLLCAGMATKHIYPFGDNTVLLWDLEIQYLKPYCWLHDVLHGNGSIFYSFEKSLGGNMYGLFSTYFISPYNLLVYFFSANKMAGFFSVVTILKISTCGLTGAIYIKNRFQMKKPGMILFLSTAFSLMEYNVSLCSNIHFLDAIYTLPLIALGIYYLVNKKKKVLLFLSALYAILTNWYIGYMVCFFSVFYFLLELFISYKLTNFKKYSMNRIFLYIRTMVLVGISSGIVLIPSLLASTNGKGNLTLEYLKPSFHCNPLYILRSLFITSEGNINYEQPAIYVSGLVLILCIMFYFEKSIEIKKRITFFVITAITFLSFSFVPLEVAWTAFKKTYSFHFRYAFVFSFLLVVTAATLIQHYQERKEKVHIRNFVITAAVLGMIFLISNFVSPYNDQTVFILFMTFLLLGLFAIAILRNSSNVQLKKVVTVIIAFLFIIEQFYNVQYTFSKYNISYSSFNNYVQQVGKTVNEVKKSESQVFYRMEQTFSEMSERRSPVVPSASEDFIFGYNGLTHYSSLYDSDVNDILANTGYCKRNVMVTNYVEPNLVMDTILGVKYVMTDEAPSTWEKQDCDLPYGNKIYKNKYALPFGVAVDKKASNFKWSDDAFANQRMMIKEMLVGSQGNDLFIRMDKEESIGEQGLTYNITVSDSGEIYAYFRSGHPDAMIYVNGEFRQTYFSRFYHNVIYLGKHNVGDKIELILKDDTDIENNHRFEVVSFNVEKYKEIFTKLNEDSFDATYVKGNEVKARYETNESKRLLLSVPYDEGWTIYVDGKKKSYKKILNGFISFKVPKGEHNIVMKYYPPYLKVGALCSLIGFIIFILLEIKERRKNINNVL